MKYYIHKETKEPMGVVNNSMCELVTGNSNSYQVIYLAIFPNRKIGNGIKFQCITNKTLGEFKRINKKDFNTICPDFGQYRHKNDKGENINYFLNSVMEVENRKETFGF